MPVTFVQTCPVDGVPLVGYGTKRLPQAPFVAKVLSITVSLWPPETVNPVPTGPAAADPAAGTSPVLLFSETLWKKTQHEWVWVILEVPPLGQSPVWGAGGSPETAELVSAPSWLWSNFEFSMMIWPPEFVPE